MSSAETVYVFHPTVTAGTTTASPSEYAMTFPPSDVVRIEIRIPSGTNGLSGIAIAQAHQPVIPLNSGAYIVSNDELISWDISGYLDTGSWSAIMYNSDAFDHSYEVRFLCQLIGKSEALRGAQVQPINFAQVA